MKILVLSCNTGEGHNAAGRAIVEWAEKMGHEAVMEDMMLLAGKRASKMVGGTYVGIVRHVPRFFHLLYRIGGKLSSAHRRSPVYYANSLLAKPVLRYLQEHSVDIVITPHLFPAETLTYMKRKGMCRIPVLAVATDYTCIPFWEETRCDGYIIPHEDLVGEFMGRGIPKEKLFPLGIPVAPRFSQKEEMKRSRTLCGLPLDGRAFLIMGGSMGFGKIHLFVAELLRRRHDGDSVVIICGNNQKLQKTLNRLFGGMERVFILGFTREVSRYMDACDVIFTKPGGLTSTEAAAKGIPIVHTNPIPGCETANVQFFTKKGMSLSARKIQEQLQAGEKLLHEKDRENMLFAQRESIHEESAKVLIKLAEKMVEENQSEMVVDVGRKMEREGKIL